MLLINSMLKLDNHLKASKDSRMQEIHSKPHEILQDRLKKRVKLNKSINGGSWDRPSIKLNFKQYAVNGVSCADVNRSINKNSSVSLSLSGTNFFALAKEWMDLDCDEPHLAYKDQNLNLHIRPCDFKKVPQLRKSLINFTPVCKFLITLNCDFYVLISIL